MNLTGICLTRRRGNESHGNMFNKEEGKYILQIIFNPTDMRV